MQYEKPQIISKKEGSNIVVMCARGNKCNGPKDLHIQLQ